jgi:hypothetical protein
MTRVREGRETGKVQLGSVRSTVRAQRYRVEVEVVKARGRSKQGYDPKSRGHETRLFSQAQSDKQTLEVVCVFRYIHLLPTATIYITT